LDDTRGIGTHPAGFSFVPSRNHAKIFPRFEFIVPLHEAGLRPAPLKTYPLTSTMSLFYYPDEFASGKDLSVGNLLVCVYLWGFLGFSAG
jgi:hypothetical protein